MHIAIVDDVITTGSTLQAIALQLKNAGARQVDVWAALRTQSHPKH
jgi:predicted amidophosphoribosyltransferase